jgi:hypothetical protein
MFQLSFEPSSGNIHIYIGLLRKLSYLQWICCLSLITLLQYTIFGRICFCYSNVYVIKLHPSTVLKILIELQMLRQYNVKITYLLATNYNKQQTRRLIERNTQVTLNVRYLFIY